MHQVLKLQLLYPQALRMPAIRGLLDVKQLSLVGVDYIVAAGALKWLARRQGRLGRVLQVRAEEEAREDEAELQALVDGIIYTLSLIHI